MLNKKLAYLERYYPEKSEFQKTLEREIQMTKAGKMKPVPKTEYQGARSKWIYENMYQLNTHTNMNPDFDI